MATGLASAGRPKNADLDNSKLIGELPVFNSEDAPPFDPSSWRLLVRGLVKNPLRLSYGEILKLPTVHLTVDFTCAEGWTVKATKWEGIKIRTIIELAEPLPRARYAMVKAGRFITTLSLNELSRDETILAHRYKSRPLTFEHGAPIRLLFPSQECFESIKWVNEIEITERYLEGTAKNIALKRLKDRPNSANASFRNSLRQVRAKTDDPNEPGEDLTVR